MLLALQALELDYHAAPDVKAPVYVPMHAIKLPPPSSYPAAASVLSRYPASVSLLIFSIQRSAARIPTIERAVEDCSAGLEVSCSSLSCESQYSASMNAVGMNLSLKCFS